MATFETAVEAVLRHERGYVNDPLDAGGETNFGISKRRYPTVDIKGLTRDQAIFYYKRDFWLPGFSIIEDQAVATKFFVLYVNLRPRSAVRVLQRAILAAGIRVKHDGIFGPKTLMAVNDCNPKALLAAMKSEAAGHYRLIVAADPTQKKFLNGWLKRAYANEEES